RNALMYFTPETQARILGHFNCSLTQTGYLFLGKSEMLITHSELFKPLSLKWRVFTKVPRPGLRDRLAFVNQIARAGDEEVSQRYPQLRDAAADSGPAAQAPNDRTGVVADSDEPAR